MDPITPLDHLLAQVERAPEQTAFVAGDARWTYRRLAEESLRLAGGMQANGVKAGDVVALHMLNIPALVVAYYACFRTGALAVPVNTRLKAEELSVLLARVRPVLYLGQPELFPAIASISDDLLPSSKRFDAAKLSSPGSITERATDPDAPAVLLATSGTTGRSKLVVHTARTLNAAADSGRLGTNLSVDAVALLVLPLVHAGGLGCVLACIQSGAPFVLLPSFEPDAVLDAIARHRCTWFAGLPFMAALMALRQRQSPRDVASLRDCFIGGDACSPELERSFQTTMGVPIRTIWAASEVFGAMGPGIGSSVLTNPLPGTKIRLVDEAGCQSIDGEPGELLVRSHSMSPGYWVEPGRIDPLADGWFHSGDIMLREPDGQLLFLGRRKDLIVRGGSNVAPMEVESIMREHLGVADVAVVGIADPVLGQNIAGAIVLAPEAGPDVLSAILAAARARLADYKVPEHLVPLSVIPRTPIGKIDRQAVASALERELNARIVASSGITVEPDQRINHLSP